MPSRKRKREKLARQTKEYTPIYFSEGKVDNNSRKKKKGNAPIAQLDRATDF